MRPPGPPATPTMRPFPPSPSHAGPAAWGGSDRPAERPRPDDPAEPVATRAEPMGACPRAPAEPTPIPRSSPQRIGSNSPRSSGRGAPYDHPPLTSHATDPDAAVHPEHRPRSPACRGARPPEQHHIDLPGSPQRLTTARDGAVAGHECPATGSPTPLGGFQQQTSCPADGRPDPGGELRRPDAPMRRRGGAQAPQSDDRTSGTAPASMSAWRPGTGCRPAGTTPPHQRKRTTDVIVDAPACTTGGPRDGASRWRRSQGARGDPAPGGAALPPRNPRARTTREATTMRR